MPVMDMEEMLADIQQRLTAQERKVSTNTYTAAEVDTIMPIGGMLLWVTPTIPDRFLVADGRSLVRTDYPELFAVIGTTYGGTGTTFSLPDYRGRVPVGVDSSQPEFDALNDAGGEKTHLLTTNEMPAHAHTGASHTHSVNDPGHNHTQDPHSHSGGSHTHSVDASGTQSVITSVSGTGVSTTSANAANNLAGSTGSASVTVGSTTATNNSADTNITIGSTTPGTGGSTGGGTSHNNLQPYRTAQFLIRAK